jgi:hypothetical protein
MQPSPLKKHPASLGNMMAKGAAWMTSFRIIASSLVMSVVVPIIKLYWEIPSTVVGRVAYIATASGIGALVYGSCVFLLRHWRANPDSAEAWIWMQVTNILNDVFGRIRVSFRQMLCAKELHK